jgi:hypothetical protein
MRSSVAPPTAAAAIRYKPTQMQPAAAPTSRPTEVSTGRLAELPAPEADCPWFDPAWLLDHPDFPLAADVAAAIQEERNADV